MLKIAAISVLLIIILPMYITYTKFGSIQFGEFFSAITTIFTIVALFYIAISIAILKDNANE